jgi:hypothetical protein
LPGHNPQLHFLDKGINMAQIDISPATNPSLGIHFHGPAGTSAAAFNNPTDSPATMATAGGKPVTANIAPALGGPRFSNPS